MTVNNLSKLPDQKLKEVSDFAESLLDQSEDKILSEGIKKIVEKSKAFKFLEDGENLYTVNDLKGIYK